jgi:NADH:ubiquinone oxidoreductase subunit F (NADH-binding)
MSAPGTVAEARGTRRLATVPEGLPRLFSGIRPEGTLSLREHEALHGPLPHVHSGSRRRARERAAMLIDEVERAGLLGRGGAAFPTAAKLRAVARSSGRAIVVVNAVEAEPASLKDRVLIEALPHLVLDGAILAAEALRADEVVLAIGERAAPAAEQMQAAIDERGQRSRGRAPRLSIAGVPASYVAGQETALVHHLNGGPAKPTFTPPLPFERGVRRRPTLVSNAETLAHLALIARHGAAWFRELGTPAQPGSTLVTLSGAVGLPGAYEIEPGVRLGSLLESAGGASASLAGVLMGGYGGTWIAGSALDGLALCNEQLASHGASLGAGVIALLSTRACPVRETARLGRWLAHESARQCGPCTFGLPALAEVVEQIADGAAGARALERIGQLGSLISRRGACAHPDLAVKTVTSALLAFEPEFLEHVRHGPCARCACASSSPCSGCPTLALMLERVRADPKRPSRR